MGTRSGIAPARAVAPLAVALVASLAVAQAAPARTARAHTTRHVALMDATAGLRVLPKAVTAGEPVLVVGRLPSAAQKTVTLWERASSGSAYTEVAQTTADATGSFEFVQPGDPPEVGASFYAASPGARTAAVREGVTAAVSLEAGTGLAPVGQPVTLSGQVLPAGRPGAPVLIQRATGAAGQRARWRTIARVAVAPDGTFTASVRFPSPQAVTLRALYSSDPRVAGGASDPVDLIVQRAPGAGALSLVASADPVNAGQAVALTGTLAGAGPGQAVTLLSQSGSASSPQPAGTTQTDAAGDFSFAQTPLANSLYRVQAVGSSAQVLVGVRPLVSLAAPSAPMSLGQRLVASGLVTPGVAGQSVELEQLGQDGAYHPVAVSRLVRAGRGAPAGSAAFHVTTTLSEPGLRTFRALVPGGPITQTGISPAVDVSVSLAPAAAILLTMGRAQR